MEVPTKTKTRILYYPVMPLLGMCLDKTIIQKDTCTPMFHKSQGIETTQEITNDDCLKNLWYTHIYTIYTYKMEYYSAINGTPLQHSCLENPMDGGAWWGAVHRVAKSRT